MTNREAPINQVLTTSSHTVNYDLPLWEGQDITSWLTTMNDAMDKIDTAIYKRQADIVEINNSVNEALDKANAASEAAQNATEAVPQLQQDMRTVKSQVLLNTTNITKNSQAIANLSTENGSINLSLTQIQNDISETNNKITKISGSMAILQEKVDAIPDNVTDLAEQVQTNTNDIANLKTEDTAIKTSIQQLHDHINTIDGEVAQNITDIAASKQWEIQTGQTIDTMQTSIQNNLNSITEITAFKEIVLSTPNVTVELTNLPGGYVQILAYPNSTLTFTADDVNFVANIDLLTQAEMGQYIDGMDFSSYQVTRQFTHIGATPTQSETIYIFTGQDLVNGSPVKKFYIRCQFGNSGGGTKTSTLPKNTGVLTGRIKGKVKME